MLNNGLFPNQDYVSSVLKHTELPVYITESFRFFRCISFDKSFYGLTLSELHSGNLRSPTDDNRYSKLFPVNQISYWADSKKTAMAEIKYHLKLQNRNHNNLITFFAYDDASSTFPSLSNTEPLIIVDGRELGFSTILDKFENGQQLTTLENDVIQRITDENPDCLAYESKRVRNGINYLFLEKGFKKLALREVSLRLGDEPGRNTCIVQCAIASDYSPIPESYGYSFHPIARMQMNNAYLNTDEYISRKAVIDNSYERIIQSYRNT